MIGSLRLLEIGRAAATVAVFLAVLLCVVPAGAQVLDYNRLFGTGSEAEPATSVPQSTTPQQSRPSSEPGGAALSAEDYARVAASAPQQMLSATQKAIKLFRERLIGIWERSPGAFKDINTTLAAASPTGRGKYFLGVAVFAGLLLVIGKAVTAFYIHFVARPIFVRMQSGGFTGYVDKLPVLIHRVLMTVLGLAITVIVAAAVGLFFYEDHEATQLTVLAVFATFAAMTLIDTVWRVVLGPYLPNCRLPELSDGDARRLYRWLTIASGFGVLSAAFCYWVLWLGLAREVHVLVTLVLMTVTLVLFLMLIRANASVISGVILGGRTPGRASWLSRAIAVLWAPLGALYLLITWGDLGFRLIMGIEGGPGAPDGALCHPAGRDLGLCGHNLRDRAGLRPAAPDRRRQHGGRDAARGGGRRRGCGVGRRR